MAKRGRPLGATSWWRTLENVAAHHANVLLELWLAGAPVLQIRVMLSSLASSPKHQAMIEECWSARKNERRYTVPPRIKQRLCELAVAHVVELHRDAILRQRALEAERELRIQGWTDTQIAEILKRAATEHSAVYVKAPNVDKVLKIVNRRTPVVTLRRRKADRRILRK